MRCDVTKIGENMVAARHRKGVSRTWLARKSGVPKTTISGYESGRTLAGVYNLLCLADALEISLDEYIGRSVEVCGEND